MTDSRDMEQLVRELHAARIEARLGPLCALFAEDAHFRIAGSSDSKPIAIDATGLDAIRPWLATLVKTFKVTDYQLLSRVVEGQSAALHWRASIHSRITGSTVATELVDLIEVRGGRIVSYVEFFVPR
jgi:ketosteroid isomerase-like protein